ncbi:MAG TPA: hypothetical protein VKE91_13385 [Blastocatellia bacterium]|nr:hypothetical protein [Blastocatellia bacterium]
MRSLICSSAKDIYHYYEEPGRTALNKAHPALNTMGCHWRERC